MTNCPFKDVEVSQIAPDDVSKACYAGCTDAACCLNSEQGENYERCLAQLRRRLGGDPEPGDVCGSCGISWR